MNKNKIKKVLFVITIIAIILIKILLTSNLQINGKYNAKYDDALMVRLANNIIEGKWLGEYNCLTLIKGVVTPIFIAVSYFLHIPFLIAQELLYIGACLLFTIIIKKKIPNKIGLIVIFTILVFSPITYSTNITRVYRDGIYTSFVLYLIALTYGIFLNKKEPAKKLVKYFIALGIVIGLIYNTREETIWILPFILISSIITIVFIIKLKDISQKRLKISLYLIPILIVCTINISIATVNYKYYGVFTLNQYWGKEFKEAYGALTRVIPKKRIKRVPVTRDTMAKLYKISPKFKELEDYLEGPGYVWAQEGDISFGEIQGGWLHWAIMRAVESKGYYENAQTANKYYKELANEINTAIDEGKIYGLPYKRVSNTTVTTFEDIPKILKRLIKVIKFQYKMNKIETRASVYKKSNEDIKRTFENVTRNKMITAESYEKDNEKLALSILDKIDEIYTFINPYIFKLSIITYVIIMILFFIRPKKLYEEFLILSGLLCIYLCRTTIIAYTVEQMYTDALNTMYLSSIYAVQYLFGILGILFTSKILIEFIHKLKGLYKTEINYK